MGLYIVWCIPSATLAEKINIAVASNFAAAIKQLIEKFEKTSTHKIQVSFGSSGKLYAQINHGAPFHIFFSGDQTKPSLLAKNGLAIKSTQFTYALGQLVLWRAGNPSDNKPVNRKTLTSIKFNHLAIASPKFAPYGIAAMQVLKTLNITQKTTKKLVLGENINQTYHFVASGAAQYGLVAMSQMYKINPASYWEVDEDLYQPIKQDVILLQKAKKSKAALAFLKFIQHEDNLKLIEAFGYQSNLDKAPLVD